MNNEIIKLFKMIVQRNKLAKVRTSARLKLYRSRRYVEYALRHTGAKKLSDSDFKDRLYKMLELADKYKQSCSELAKFTAETSKFRKYMQGKYKTKQQMCANNCVKSIYLDTEDGLHIFRISDIVEEVMNDEINGILLDAPIR